MLPPVFEDPICPFKDTNGFLQTLRLDKAFCHKYVKSIQSKLKNVTNVAKVGFYVKVYLVSFRKLS